MAKKYYGLAPVIYRKSLIYKKIIDLRYIHQGSQKYSHNIKISKASNTQLVRSYKIGKLI